MTNEAARGQGVLLGIALAIGAQLFIWAGGLLRGCP